MIMSYVKVVIRPQFPQQCNNNIYLMALARPQNIFTNYPLYIIVAYLGQLPTFCGLAQIKACKGIPDTWVERTHISTLTVFIYVALPYGVWHQ